MKNQINTFKWPLIGNRHITDFLERCLVSEQMSGAYIFNGPDNLGKTSLALHLAQILLCHNYPDKKNNLPCLVCPTCKHFSGNFSDDSQQAEINPAHGDLHLLKKDKDKKNIAVEQVREFIRTLSMTSFLNSYKIGIIKHAETLSSEGANALLKTLEEPREKVIIILITSNLESMLPTIVSRSKVLNFNLVKPDIIYDYLVETLKAPRSQAVNCSRLSLGRPALAVKFFENKDFAEKYEKQSGTITAFVSQGINQRLESLNDILDKELAGQELVRTAQRILEVWQGVLRDVVLLHYGHNDFIQHHLSMDELQTMKDKLNIGDIVNRQKMIKEASAFIEANVSPRFVLENIAINF